MKNNAHKSNAQTVESSYTSKREEGQSQTQTRELQQLLEQLVRQPYVAAKVKRLQGLPENLNEISKDQTIAGANLIHALAEECFALGSEVCEERPELGERIVDIAMSIRNDAQKIWMGAQTGATDGEAIQVAIREELVSYSNLHEKLAFFSLNSGG